MQSLWTPPNPAGTRMERFRQRVAALDPSVVDSTALHTWSVANLSDFWALVWEDCGVLGDSGAVAFVPAADRRDRVRRAEFFPGSSVSVAENLLAPRRGAHREAVVEVSEDGARRSLTWDELRSAVAALAAALREAGVRPLDRVAAWMPNSIETVVTFAAANAIGATFTSTSSEFGPDAVIDRFGQTEPTVLVATDGYRYGGKAFDGRARLAEIARGLPSVRAVVVAPVLAAEPDLSGIERAVAWEAFVGPHRGAALTPLRLPGDHPVYILYSSGTTGRPKCIVHRALGVLLMHLKEHQLHCDVRPGDRMSYFTTCGWMMWNWQVSALASGATIVLYDGSPTHPGLGALFDLAEREEITLLGLSAKLIDSVRKSGLRPADSHRLDALRTICSTGSPLGRSGYEWVYDAVKQGVHLASISGGTDLCGCLVAGDPTRPVRSGEIQGPALGMAIDVWDDEGRSLTPGQTGELVCTEPFPSVPLGFWGDPDGRRLQTAYFDRFDGVWAHGDFAAWTDGRGIVIHGRSDATLNAGGVRIGTAEIYGHVESLPEVDEAVAVGQAWDGDTRIVLFVRLAAGRELTAALETSIRQRLRAQASPRHVPARIAAVADIPRTRSGKISELAVADVVNGRPVRNAEALANPAALEEYRDRLELAT